MDTRAKSPAFSPGTSPDVCGTASPHMFSQIQVLLLNAGEHLERELFRISKGSTVRFVLGPSLFGQKVTVYTNFPSHPEGLFERSCYRELKWESQSTNKSDDTSLYLDLTFEKAGSFHYYFICDGMKSIDWQGSGYFVVDPVLTYGPENDVLPLDCIQCQTFLSKCLGPFSGWENRLRVSKESGFNMIHFTPIQELGASHSSYSISDFRKLNPLFSSDGSSCTIDDVAKLVEKMKREWKVLSLTDVVLNHAANESQWLKEHPECAFNVQNSPHLRPAYLLDRVIWHFGLEIAQGKWEHAGITAHIQEEKHLDAMRQILLKHFLPQVKLPELYIVDINTVVEEFKVKVKEVGGPSHGNSSEADLVIIQDPEYRRLKSTVNMDKALAIFNVSRGDASNEDERIQKCSEAFRNKLEELNKKVADETQIHLNAAVENVLAGVRYERLQHDGPKIKELSPKHPLVPLYFTHHGPDTSLEEEEKLMFSEDSCYLMAHNGWVMNDDPLRNFADKSSNVYIRRELIAWGDSVKLRYGSTPSDCPFLWEYMKNYVQEMARTFHGLRLDNCHSTPLNVAEYMLDAARAVRKDLYVIAELFTSSELVDNVFVNRLGLTSLIREAMSAHDAHEEGRLVYRYGGDPVGAFFRPPVRPLSPCISHAILLDVTHDNPSPIQKRSIYDLLPTAALTSMACCATGSTRGYDELVPHHIHVVKENRFYASWTDDVTSTDPTLVNPNSGIISARHAISKLHSELGFGGFSQVYVDQVDANIIAVTRHSPASHQSVILVARTAFSPPHNPKETGRVPPLCIPGVVNEIIFEARLLAKSQAPEWTKHDAVINGLQNYRLDIRENIQLNESGMVELNQNSEYGLQEVLFTSFPPGSVVAFRVSLHTAARDSILMLRKYLTQFGYRLRSYSGTMLTPPDNHFFSILNNLDLQALNLALFRCDAEERDDGRRGGAYDIPKYGALTYCGLQGIISILAEIRAKNDLGHPLCENLRAGDWLSAYVSDRLLQHNSTKALGKWFKNVFAHLSVIPRYLIPCYFDSIVTGAYSALLSAVWKNMSDFVLDGSEFVRALALGSAILTGYVRSAPLPPLSPHLADPKPPSESSDQTGKTEQCCSTIAAGLPHFATGYMRNWGRDTFIALRGLLLLTGRYQEARFIILAFAGCLRHGLIPNLLNRGIYARFNCRDAVWWWLQCIQDYCNVAPDGHSILKDSVARLYPTDDWNPEEQGHTYQELQSVMQEALERHIQGVQFRERNAGFKLDREMTDQGFNNHIGVNLETGFVYGGNEYNCGTWMDKMGSSEKAGNKGKPATPRDGSAVELVGLCKSCLRWLTGLNKSGIYPHDGVTNSSTGKHIRFDEWQELIQENFEKYFWISPEPRPEFEPAPQLINRRGIYKDSFGATQFWADYQLRPNFLITMVVAPELFTPENAWIAIKSAESILLGPLGMKTLDPKDWAYDGNYVNSDDSWNGKIARGFNYHQGPEWVWPLGFFLRAKLHFAPLVGGQKELDKAVSFTKRVLHRHFEEIQASKWNGLPELTNKDGAHCSDSCPIQAWSHSCLLEVLYDLDQLAAKTG